MQTHALQFGRHKTQSHSHAQQIGGSFASSHPKSSGDPHHDALVKQTQKWVAQTFYGEMLKQMRNSPFKSKMFEGGEGGQAFTQMFDQQLADKMATGSGRKLVDSIVNKIEAGKAYAKVAAKPVSEVPRRPGSTGETSGSSEHLRDRLGRVDTHHARIKPVQMSPTLKAKIGGLQ
jgi:Rod binding domain-containing protein